MAAQLRPAITGVFGNTDALQVVVSGETNNISLYILGSSFTIAYAPFSSIRSNPVIRQVEAEEVAEADEHLILLRTSDSLCNRLSFPVVVLINPCVREVFPSPRLPLCICSLAAHLRQRQIAEVHLIDMQLDDSIDAAVQAVLVLDPKIIGVSVSFGQTDVAIDLLRRLYAQPNRPLVVLGNVIASFAAGTFLKLFPDLIIAKSEGEITLDQLIEFTNGERELDQVTGIIYQHNGDLRQSVPMDVPMKETPLPSMDLVEAIARRGGALTMELSRGCFHSACTFCPRTHKPRRWKGVPVENALDQLGRYAQVIDHLGCQRRLFMADEEFIGWSSDDTATERIGSIMQGMLDNNLNLRFETNTRIDQIYNSGEDRTWHGKRFATLDLCRKAGLERLLVGVESGSNSVLKRFNKNISALDSVMALRLLSGIGIGFRITFITFDPLMNFSELIENINFLSRQDAYLKPLDCPALGWENLYDAVHDDTFVRANSVSVPLYENVSYMLVSLEVLKDSKYATFVCNGESGILASETEHFDPAMARHRVQYVDPILGAIALGCQKWVDRHFALDYYLKGLYKTAPAAHRETVFAPRREYRRLSFELLRFLAAVFAPEGNSVNVNDVEVQKFRDRTVGLSSVRIDQVVEEILDLFNSRMSELVRRIETSCVSGAVPDPAGGLPQVIAQWRQRRSWTLVNP
jgi:hypothetical protein